MEKILVVEDRVSDVIFLKKILEKENYDIVYAENGKDALTIVENNTPDLVILDIVLPDIDGFEICKRIRNNNKLISLPILFYSAIKTIDDKLLGLEMGASDFLSKSADDRELLARIKNLLKAKKKVDSAISFSFYDTMTNVYSPQYLEHRINEECIRSSRYKRDFSCMLMGVDNFKVINNTLGVITGDRMLKKIAELLVKNIRSADEVCRYKDDEFGVLMPETNLRSAFALAERIRDFMSSSDELRAESSLKLTVSCGVSQYNSEIKEAKKLINQIKLALNQAKSEGRNKTQFYSSH
ncbi:MAG: diguanylate cyclase [Candidatus Omnitrophota bacterium]